MSEFKQKLEAIKRAYEERVSALGPQPKDREAAWAHLEARMGLDRKMLEEVSALDPSDGDHPGKSDPEEEDRPTRRPAIKFGPKTAEILRQKGHTIGEHQIWRKR